MNRKQRIWPSISTAAVALTSAVLLLALPVPAGHALSPRELAREVSAERQKWFEAIYATIVGAAPEAGVALSGTQVRDFLLDRELLQRLTTERVGLTVCSLGGLDALSRQRCNADPRRYFASDGDPDNDVEAVAAIAFVEKGLTGAIFDGDGQISVDYEDQVFDAVSDAFQSVNADNLDSLLGFRLPVLNMTLAQARVLPAKPAELVARENEVPDPALVDDLSTFVSVRRSFFNAEDVSKAAIVGVRSFGSSDETRDGGKDTVLNINGAVVWTPLSTFGTAPEPRQWFPKTLPNVQIRTDLVVGVEAQMSATNDGSLISHFVGAEFNQSPVGASGGRPFASNIVKGTLNYRTDRRYSADIFGATAEWTPSWPAIGWGRDVFGGRDDLDFLWRPYLGVSFEDVNDPGILPDTEAGEQFNLTLRTIGKLRYGRLALVPEVKLTRQLDGDDDGTHLAYGATLELKLDEEGQFVASASYERGEEAPTFQEKDQWFTGLGVKF